MHQFGRKPLLRRLVKSLIQILHTAHIGTIQPTTDKEQTDPTHTQINCATLSFPTKPLHALIYIAITNDI